jgi:ubiquinone/menaquinone biosynthesis C-methylase UbiE
MLTWFALAVILISLGLFLYWTLVISEGAYFGARFVAWLYDLSARRYDRIKEFDDEEEDWYVGLPLWRTIQSVQRPLVLDVATGTGRLPLALLRRPQFEGRIVALDLSRKMLRQAHAKLAPFGDRVTLLRQDAMHLPFPNEIFDAVTCLEALEFVPDPTRALNEMLRVLRPGGALLTTNRVGWEAKLLPGKAFSPGRLRAILNDLPLQTVEVRRWQVFYRQVWARKRGRIPADGNGGLGLSDILCCPHCAAAFLQETAAAWQCPACRATYPVQDGVLSLADGVILERTA